MGNFTYKCIQVIFYHFSHSKMLQSLANQQLYYKRQLNTKANRLASNFYKFDCGNFSDGLFDG